VAGEVQRQLADLVAEPLAGARVRRPLVLPEERLPTMTVASAVSMSVKPLRAVRVLGERMLRR
jgi:hypothetical protein